MSTHTIAFPEADEYAPYYQAYLDTLPEGNVLDILEQQMQEVVTIIMESSDEQLDHRYAEGKWSVREVIGHCIDTERVFAYRGLAFARGETAALPGYDGKAYVEHAAFPLRSRESLAGEYEAQRLASLFLFETWDEAAQLRRGNADGKQLSARAIPWVIAGHERHHLSVIRERYFTKQD